MQVGRAEKIESSSLSINAATSSSVREANPTIRECLYQLLSTWGESPLQANGDFREIRTFLKQHAKSGLMSWEEGQIVLDVLQGAHFKEYYKDSNARGGTYCPTRLLFFSHKLYDALLCEKQHPIVQQLSDETVQVLLVPFDVYTLSKIPLDTLAEVVWAVKELAIPELSTMCEEAIAKRLQNFQDISSQLSMKALYLLASGWPKDHRETFSSLGKSKGFPDESTPESVSSEWKQFSAILTHSEGIDRLLPVQLHRFHSVLADRMQPALRTAFMNRLWGDSISGELDLAQARDLFKTTSKLSDWPKEFEQYSVQTADGRKYSFWTLFLHSDFVRRRFRSPMRENGSLHLDLGDITDISFSIIYDWMKTGNLETTFLSMEELLDLQSATDFLQLDDFEESKKKIIGAIRNHIQQNVDVDILAAYCTRCFAPQLDECLVEYLSNNIFSLQRLENGRYECIIKLQSPKPLHLLDQRLTVVKALMQCSHLIERISFESISSIAWDIPMIRLMQMYCCTQLGLFNKRNELESELKNVYVLEKDFRRWRQCFEAEPFDFFLMIGEIKNGQLRDRFFKMANDYYLFSPYWKAVKSCAQGFTSTTIQEELELFEQFIHNPDSIPEHADPEKIVSLVYYLSAAKGRMPSETWMSVCANLTSTITAWVDEGKLTADTLAQFRMYTPCSGIFNAIRLAGKIPLSFVLAGTSEWDVATTEHLETTFGYLPEADLEKACQLLLKEISDQVVTRMSSAEANELSIDSLRALYSLVTIFMPTEHHRRPKCLKNLVSMLPAGIDEVSDEKCLTLASLTSAVGDDVLLNYCLRKYCDVNFEYDGHQHFRLSSLDSRSLEMLRAVGPHVKGLYIHINEKKGNRSQEHGERFTFWMEIASRCPNLEVLSLYVTGKPPGLDLETLPLNELCQLECLRTKACNSRGWDALSRLGIPSSVKKIHLATSPLLIQRSNNWGFYDDLDEDVQVTVELLDKSTPQKKSWLEWMFTSHPNWDLLLHVNHCDVHT